MTTLELALLAKLGHLAPTDLIWSDGFRDWVAAGSVAGLIPPPEKRWPDGSLAGGMAHSVGPANLASLFESYGHREPLPSRHEDRPAVYRDTRASQLPARSTGDALSTLRDARMPAAPPVQPAMNHSSAFRGSPDDVMRAAPSRPESAPSTTVGGVVGYTTLDALSVDIGQYVADAVILALDKYDIRTLDDLANDERLQVLATYSCDFFPATVRFLINRTVGRAAFEAYMFDFLLYARGRIPRQHRAADLRASVRELARTPWLSQRLKALYEKSRSGMSALVSSYMPAGGLSAARTWTGRVAGARAQTAVPALAAPAHISFNQR